MLKSKIKYGDQQAHAVTAAFQLVKHRHARALLILQNGWPEICCVTLFSIVREPFWTSAIRKAVGIANG